MTNDPEIKELLAKIEKNTDGQLLEIASNFYITGVLISAGANFALGAGLGSLLVCWLSWLNVGYILGEFVRPVLHAG